MCGAGCSLFQKKTDTGTIIENTSAQPTQGQGSVGSISDNPGYPSAAAKSPSCDLEKWIVTMIQPSVDKIFEASKFISSGTCSNIPYSGGKFVTKKLLAAVGAASDAKDMYNDLCANGFSTDNSPVDLGANTEMTVTGLWGSTPVQVYISFDLTNQVMNIKVNPKP